MIDILADQQSGFSVGGEVILWVFGIVWGVVTVLVGVIYKMLNEKIDKQEQNFRQDLDRIEARNEEDRQSNRGIVQRIFDKIEEMGKAVNNIAVQIASQNHNKGDHS